MKQMTLLIEVPDEVTTDQVATAIPLMFEGGDFEVTVLEVHDDNLLAERDDEVDLEPDGEAMAKLEAIFDATEVGSEPNREAVRQIRNAGGSDFAREHYDEALRVIVKLTDEALCTAVAAFITNGPGPFVAEALYTGGGIWCVGVKRTEHADWSAMFGMAGDTWGGDVYADGKYEELSHDVWTAVASDSQDPTAIASALIAACFGSTVPS